MDGRPDGSDPSAGGSDRRSFIKALAGGAGGLAVLAAGCQTGAPEGVGGVAPLPPPSADRFSLYHEVHGDGPPLVFAHGAGGTHLSWWQQVPYFSSSYQCIVYDQRGFGFSPDYPGGPGRAAFVDDLRDLLDELEIERASLVGQSMGGRSVLGFAAAYPERVDRLVLSGTTGGYTDPDLEAARERAPNLGTRSAYSIEYRRRDPAGAFLYSSISRINDYLQPERPEGESAPSAPMPDIQRVIDASIPVLFVVGNADTVAPPSVTVALQEKIPSSQLVRFDDSGHSPYWEIPDRFNEAVMEFLQEPAQRRA